MDKNVDSRTLKIFFFLYFNNASQCFFCAITVFSVNIWLLKIHWINTDVVSGLGLLNLCILSFKNLPVAQCFVLHRKRVSWEAEQFQTYDSDHVTAALCTGSA